MGPAWLELIRRLALNDEHALAQVMGGQAIDPLPLDAKTSALIRLAALVALDAGGVSYQWAVDTAQAAGAEDTEIVDVLFAMVPVVGPAKVEVATPFLAQALGYELGDG